MQAVAYTKPHAGPTPRLLEAIASEAWDTPAAIAELIDNALGRERGDAQDVWISVDRGNGILRIRDNGRGMSSPSDLVQFGAGREPQAGDLGRYGVGGSKAGVWLGYAMTVETFRRQDGLWHRIHADWGQMIAANDWQAFEDSGPQLFPPTDATPELVHTGHGTCITLYLRLDRRTFQAPAVLRGILDLYAPALRGGRRIWWNGEQLSAPAIPDEALAFRLVIPVHNGETLTASGHAWIDADAPLSRSGIDIAYLHRVIMPHNRSVFMREVRRGVQFSGHGLCGAVTLHEGWEPYLSTTKETLKHQRVYEKLLDALATELSPLIQERQRAQHSVRLDHVNLKQVATLKAVFDGTVNIGGRKVIPNRPPSTPHGPHANRGGPDPQIVTRRLPTIAGRATVPASQHIQVGTIPTAAMGGKACDVLLDPLLQTVTINIDEAHPACLAAQANPETGSLPLTILVLDHFAMALAMLDRDPLRRLLTDRRHHPIAERSAAERMPLLAGLLMRGLQAAQHAHAARA